MGPPMTLDEALSALLYRLSFRERFVRGERSGLSDDDVRALSALDLEELERVARRACGALLERPHRGVGTLRDAFPQTIDAWTRAHPGRQLDELGVELANAPAFEACSAVQACPGISLEEAFFRFAEDRAIGEPEVRVRELVTAIMKSLVVTPRPFFALPEMVWTAPGGHFAVLEPGPTLVAALEGRLVVGPITAFLAAVLSRPEALDEHAARSGVTSADAGASMTELRRMGLLA
jgi:hypothetical protein